MKLLDSTAKTNWKFIAIVVVLGLVAVGGILLLRGYSRNPSPLTPAPVVSDKIANWQTYRNEEFGFEVRYPPHWKLEEGLEEGYEGKSYSGEDGFFRFLALKEIGIGGIDDVSKYEAYFDNPYGSQPVIENLKIEDQEARLILPSGDQPDNTKNQAALVIRYPKTVIIQGNKYDYFVLWADVDHIKQILSTFRFIGQKMKQADDQNSCEKQGGKWQKAGAIQGSMCIFTYADGGKKCTSSDECEGDCIVTQDSQTTGFCKQNTNPFGCFSTIESVKKGNGILCRD